MKRYWTKWTSALALAGLVTLSSQSASLAGDRGGKGGFSGGSSRMSSSMGRGSFGGSSAKSPGGSSFKSNSLSGGSLSGRSSNFAKSYSGGSNSNLNRGSLNSSNFSSKNLGKFNDFSSMSLPKGNFGGSTSRLSDAAIVNRLTPKFPSNDKFGGKVGNPVLGKTKLPIDKIGGSPKFPTPGGKFDKSKVKLPIDKIVGKNPWPKGPVIDPGIGNGKPPKGGKHDHGHGHHHWQHWFDWYGHHGHHHHGHHHHDHHHHGHHHYCPPVVIHYPFPEVCYEPVTEVVVVEHVVEKVVVAENAPQVLDVQLVEIRQVDAGSPEKQEGPLLRVLIRNNSTSAISQPFDVALVATAGGQPNENSPYAMQKVERMDAGQTLALDVRMPAETSAIGLSADGQPEPYKTLYGAVDVAQQLTESDEENNSKALDRSQIKQVDPSAVAING